LGLNKGDARESVGPLYLFFVFSPLSNPGTPVKYRKIHGKYPKCDLGNPKTAKETLMILKNGTTKFDKL